MEPRQLPFTLRRVGFENSLRVTDEQPTTCGFCIPYTASKSKLRPVQNMIDLIASAQMLWWLPPIYLEVLAPSNSTPILFFMIQTTLQDRITRSSSVIIWN